jgi:hypothetical protein
MNPMAEDRTLTDPTDQLSGISTYLEGKMKRYNLMFAVNGGAFAVAKLIAKGGDRIGGLTFRELAIGACVFTVLMTTDIWFWGQMMRTEFFGGKTVTVFTWVGKGILLLLTLLLILGWALAAFGGGATASLPVR